MVVRGSWMMGVVCALALIAPIRAAAAAEGDQLRATVERPATVTVAARTSAAGTQSISLVVHVTGFRPATDGAVQAVVKAQMPDGTEREIGRFATFGERAQSFRISLPKELAGGGPLKLKVHLVPITGTGEGAQLEVGRVEHL